MEKKKQRIYAVITLVTLALLVVSATYAYFQNQYGDSSQTDVKVTTYTTDLLTFETGDAINITADQDTFAKGKGNQTGSSFAKAILQANSKTNVATANYYIYLNIESNEFIYTSEDNKAELVLQVTDNSGNPVTSIDGLTYVTVVDGSGTSISGFDITEKKGLITLVNNKEISANPKNEEQYNISLVLVNYDFDQNNNTGKNFNAKLMIQKDKINLLSDYVISQYTGTQGENGLYYHDSSLENGAGDNSYRYAGPDYVLTDTGKATGATSVMHRSTSDTSSLIDCMCGGKSSVSSVFCDWNIYYELKNDTTKYSQYNEAISKAIENKYIKENINNYVCFGTDDESCSVDNLYRIIGVFDGKVKLIKADYATSSLLGTDGDFDQEYELTYVDRIQNYIGSFDKGYLYSWNYKNDSTINNGKGSNEWSTSLLNKINLNTNFINNIGAKWSNIIDTNEWIVGGNTEQNLFSKNAKEFYQNEIISPSINITYNAKIGLLYGSDYFYAASIDKWTLKNKIDDSEYSGNSSDNWLFLGKVESIITPKSDNEYNVYFIGLEGTISSHYAKNTYDIRPVFYLKSSVRYSSGSGTQSDPFRISL